MNSLLAPFEPLFSVFTTLGGAFSAALQLTAFSAFAGPLVVLLLSSPQGRGAWRWPSLWWLAPVLSALVFSVMLQQGSTDLPMGALGVAGAWFALLLLTGVPRLVFRVLRFLFTGRDVSHVTRFDRVIGALGLVASVFASGLSLAAGRVAPLALFALVALLGLLLLRPRAALSPTWHALARLRWLVGTALVAMCTPPTLLCIAVLANGATLVNERGVSKGALLFVVALLGLVAGALLRLVPSASRPPTALPAPSLPNPA